MKISFSTLGCPGWDLDTICRRGHEYGFDGVDFRGLGANMDVTRLPEFSSAAAQTRRRLADAGLETSGISTSLHVCVLEELEANLEEARRTIATCQGLGADRVRIFGGGDLARTGREELARVGRMTVEKILELDGAADLHWLFETHDIWVRSADCRLLLDHIPQPAFGVLWDICHSPRFAGESPAQVMAQVGSRIGYTHVKDALYDPASPLADKDGWRYVFPGQGQMPLKEAVDLLAGAGYDGWLTYEHEKRWHPGLPEPEEAFPAYAAWAKSLLS